MMAICAAATIAWPLSFQHFQHLAGMTRALPLVVFSVGLGVFESERIKR
jgi:hypothetical protein